MVAVARESHPNRRFDEGSMPELDLEDDTLGGIVAWYSIIHTPPLLLPVLFAEFHRVLAAGATCYSRFRSAMPACIWRRWTRRGSRRRSPSRP
jgi:hypothetical protein